jgi:hypothetical protein
LDEPARLVVNVTLNTAGVLAPVQRAIRQTVDVVTFCLNAIEQGDLSGWPHSDLMRFNLSFGDEISAEERKTANTHWLLAKGFQDLARGIKLMLEEAYLYNGMVARAGGLRTLAELQAAEQELRAAATNKRFPQLLDEVRVISSFHRALQSEPARWDSPRTDKDRNVLRTITGQKPYLDQHATAKGVQVLSGANVHWWILKDEPAISNNSGFIESAGHVAALYQNELYDRATARAGTAFLQRFGILFGTRFVVLYLEPISTKGQQLTTTTARTTLLLNGEPLPWEDWAYEFREKMPKELAEFVREKGAAVTEKDHISGIKDRLKNVMDLYKVSRYRPAPAGVYLSDESSAVRVGRSPFSGAKSSEGSGGTGQKVGAGAKGDRDGEIGNIYHLFEKKGGTPSEKSAVDPFPIVNWVSLKKGTRTEDDGMEDKAAKFIQNQNTLLVNADFRVFIDMVARLCKEKDIGFGSGVESVVEEVVHQWFEQALVETVIGVQQMRGSKEWGPEEIEKALSPEALTSAVMQRYHVYVACRRDLGAKFGKFPAASG